VRVVLIHLSDDIGDVLDLLPHVRTTLWQEQVVGLLGRGAGNEDGLPIIFN